jgi:spore maturation protein SpmB
MDWTKVLIETFSGSFSIITKLTLIILPLLIAIECLKDLGWMDKIALHCQGITKIFGLPGESAIGLTIGLFTGIVFGSGVILQIQQEANMTRTQMNVLFIFIGICHAVIEETVVFTAIGANGFVIMSSRLIAAFVFTFIYMQIARLMSRDSADTATGA